MTCGTRSPFLAWRRAVTAKRMSHAMCSRSAPTWAMLKACPSISSKHVSPHVLRHTWAMHTLQATHDVRKVALWLGHASVKSTEIYLRADPAVKLEALEAGVAPKLRRGRFQAPDQLLAMLHSS